MERGLIGAEQAARLSREDTFGLLFLPGFSTSAEVTNLSGRGVGLDVVRDHLNRVNDLVVDSVLDTREIVVRPLGSLLEVIPIHAGATVMGDGRVALILDVLGLAQRAHVVSEGAERHLTEDEEPEAAEAAAERLLLFTSPDDGRMAVPPRRTPQPNSRNTSHPRTQH